MLANEPLVSCLRCPVCTSLNDLWRIYLFILEKEEKTKRTFFFRMTFEDLFIYLFILEKEKTKRTSRKMKGISPS